MWLSNCHRCTCNNRTRMEECTPRQRSVPMCSGDGVLVNTSCCGDQICGECTSHWTHQSNTTGHCNFYTFFWWFTVERKCHHRGRAYKVCPSSNQNQRRHFSLQPWLDQYWVDPLTSFLWLQIGDTWTDAANPCTTFSCSEDGVLAESPVCLTENCAEVSLVQLLPKWYVVLEYNLLTHLY